MDMSAFQPSKLGTREHWDGVYDEELKNFEDIGDEGEVWFGEDSIVKMIRWALSSAPPSRRVLEIGTGNGVLLCEFAKAGYDPSRLLGIDYSPGSITLSSEDPPRISDMQETVNSWDLLLDKGTFDAISLVKTTSGQSPLYLYPARVSRLLRPGALFLITSCNFTEEELKEKFSSPGVGLIYHSRVQHKTYHYGGKSGSVCSSVAFQKSDR